MTSFYAAWNWHMHRLGQSSPGSWKTFLVVGCAFVILSAVVLVHFMLAEFVEPPHWATLQPMLLSLYRLCALIAMPLLPQVIGDYARVIVPITAMVSVAGLFAFGLLAIDQKRIWARMQEPVVVGAISACLAIVGAVFVGRIITDGYISPWYYRFLSAYEVIFSGGRHHVGCGTPQEDRWDYFCRLCCLFCVRVCGSDLPDSIG